MQINSKILGLSLPYLYTFCPNIYVETGSKDINGLRKAKNETISAKKKNHNNNNSVHTFIYVHHQQIFVESCGH